jgi:RsmE family RNA methyltransferase
VNLLLVEPAEVGEGGACAIEGRRAAHVRDVLGARAGSVVRAGVIGGAAGSARVIADDGTTMQLALELAPGGAPSVMPVELVLAVPRPKVIARAVEIAASFAVRRVELTNAWRVDKSYLTSPKLAAAALAHSARLGAEQGATTHVCPVAVHARFMALLDARYAAPPHADAGARLVAHPGAPLVEHVALGTGGDVALAIGPEGGWIPRELDTLVARGFQPVSLGAPILRVEAAIAAALGQLALLFRRRAG